MNQPHLGETRDKLYWLPLTVALGAYALLAWQFWFVCDDAFISFRYSRNLSEGFGLRYNIANLQPVEGYSNFLWVVIGAAVHKMGLDMVLFLPLLSSACGAWLLCLVWITAREDLKLTPLCATMALLSLAIFPPFFVWASSGLATLPAALCLFGAFRNLFFRQRALYAGLYALCLALLRPEGILWGLSLAGLTVFDRSRWRIVAPYLAVLLSCFTAYFLWRANYFAAWLPNTVTNKVGMSWPIVERGARYAIVYLLTFLSPLLILPAIPAGWKQRSPALLPLILLTGALALYPVLVGGDFMTMGRFFVSLAPFQALWIGLLLQSIVAWRPAGTVVAPALGSAVIVLGLLPALGLHVLPYSVRSEFHFRHNTSKFRSELEQWAFMKSNSERWRELGEALREISRPGDSLVAGAIGNVGYYSHLHIYDRFGLVEPRVAQRKGRKAAKKSPGHDKAVGYRFFLKDNPTFATAKLIRRPEHHAKYAAKNLTPSAYQGYESRYVPLGRKDSKGRKLGLFVLQRKDALKVARANAKS